MGSLKKIPPRASKNTTSSEEERFSSVLSCLSLESRLPLLASHALVAMMPSDTDLKNQYTLKNIRKYTCLWFFGITLGLMGGMGDGSAGSFRRDSEGLKFNAGLKLSAGVDVRLGRKGRSSSQSYNENQSASLFTRPGFHPSLPRNSTNPYPVPSWAKRNGMTGLVADVFKPVSAASVVKVFAYPADYLQLTLQQHKKARQRLKRIFRNAPRHQRQILDDLQASVSQSPIWWDGIDVQSRVKGFIEKFGPRVRN